MKQQIEQVLSATANEHGVGYAAGAVISDAAQRLADALQEKVEAVIADVDDNYGYGSQAKNLLTSHGLFTEPEPEPEPEAEATEGSDLEARMGKVEEAVSRLTSLAEQFQRRFF